MTLISTALVLILGGISLLLRNELIFKWKPTILFWIMAVVFMASQYIGQKPIAQRFLETAAKEEISVSHDDWRTVNLMWVVFFTTVGGINLYVAYTFPENVWVNFKLFGLTGLTFVFVLVQATWLARRETKPDTNNGEGA